MVFQEFFGLEGFAVDFFEAGDVGVPFEEGGGRAAELDGVGVHFPDGVEDGVVVGIEDVFFEFGMAGDMHLADAFVRDVVEVVVGVEGMVLGGDVDVVDVEEDAAVGKFSDFREKFPLAHFGLVELRIAGDVFNADGDFEIVTDVLDALGGFAGGFEGVGHGEKVMGVGAVDGTPAEVVGDEGSLGTFDEIFEALEMLRVGLGDGAEVHGDAVLDDFVLFEDGVEDFEWPAAVAHVIFGDDFEPVAGGLFGEDMAVVGNAEADADAEVGEAVVFVGGHGSP